MYGWMGTILRVDLTSGKIEREPLSEELRRNYVGGRGINVRILYDEVKPGTDGLSPENILIFGTGSITGTPFAAGRMNITAMSPLTGILGDGNGGSHFSPELKYAGYDHIVFTGKAEKPVYLWIDDDEVEIRDAQHLWGKLTDETNKILKEEIGDPRIQITCIGPAGEKLSKIACIIVGRDGAVGKGGLGAVMGSKNLKAVAVRGTKGVKVANPDTFMELAKTLRHRMMHHPNYPNVSTYGTTYGFTGRNAKGGLAMRNAQDSGSFEGFDAISPQTLRKKYTVKDKACLGCLIHCRQWYKVNEGPYAGLEGVGVEISVEESFGSLLNNSYAPFLYKGYELSNQYGMDSTEVGQVIAAATEWYEKGLIKKENLQGLDLRWGNYEAFMELACMIGEREGIGDLLADGSVIAAEKLGPEAEKCITHTKRQARTNVDVRCVTAYSFGLATATRGGDHLRGSKALFGEPGQYEGVPEAVYNHNLVCTIADALEICKFHTLYLRMLYDLKDMADIYEGVTGVKVDEKGMKKIADRIWTLERAFIVREGITRKDDFLVGRYMDEPMHGGPLDGLAFDREKWNKMLDEYYEIVGWNKDGIPTRATLERLGLKAVADELERMGKLEAKIEVK